MGEVNKGGRPPADIDWEVVRKLASFRCTTEEISFFLNISLDALERHCKKIYNTTFGQKVKEWGIGGNCSLRRAQWKLAQQNSAMAIFLGKQNLGQKDDYGLKHDGNVKHQVVFYGDREPKKYAEQ